MEIKLKKIWSKALNLSSIIERTSLLSGMHSFTVDCSFIYNTKAPRGTNTSSFEVVI